jgi:hypothetical protein
MVNKKLLWRPWSRWRKKIEVSCIKGNSETAGTDERGAYGSIKELVRALLQNEPL